MLDRTTLVGLLQESAITFVDSIRGTTGAQFHFKPAAGRWSIAETAEHVIVAETGSSKLIRGKMLKEPATAEQLAQAVGGEARVDARLRTRDTPFQAPDFVLPTGRWSSVREMVEAFEESRAATIDFLLTTEVDLTRYVAPHPALGSLTGLQWAYFIVRHGERHVEQIEEVKSTPGYPDD